MLIDISQRGAHMNIEEIVAKQKEYFLTGETFELEYRRSSLEILKSEIKSREAEIAASICSDLGKSSFESYMCEIGFLLSEITYMQKNLKKFAKRSRVKTPMSQFLSKSYTVPVPRGNVLIMSPWNYPFLLTFGPLVNAIAAGNTAVVKPSAYSPATSEITKSIVEKCFEPKYVAVITGGRAENAKLLETRFDFVFFTGSQAVGKEVLRHTAETLTPAVLELGGKSPCIVDSSANIEIAAKRIVFGKFLNCGQTCVAPDHIICDRRIKDDLKSAICEEIRSQFGENALDNSNYGHIINKKHFDRILGLIDSEKLVYGGKSDENRLKIEPTVLDNVGFSDAVMQEEIFGPILPIIVYDDFYDTMIKLSELPKPLAFYLFSEDSKHKKYVSERMIYGGGCINDTIIHLATSEMGFGGVGESGMGSYHGRTGFETFSHRKSIVDKSTKIDLPMRYAPYTESNEKKVRMFLK